VMVQGRIIGALAGVLGLLAVATVGFAEEREPTKPRVPDSKLEEARALKNPVPPTPESIGKGLKVFRGIGSCNVCHGEEGNGMGIGASGLYPSPRNLTSRSW